MTKIKGLEIKVFDKFLCMECDSDSKLFRVKIGKCKVVLCELCIEVFKGNIVIDECAHLTNEQWDDINKRLKGN